MCNLYNYSSIKLLKAIIDFELIMVLNCSYSCFIIVNYFECIYLCYY